jgi:putative transposase
LSLLCFLLGHSRQAFYKAIRKNTDANLASELILKEVARHRILQPRIGTRKLIGLLQKDVRQHGIKLGRDTLFNLLRDNNLLVRNRRRRVQTTFSRHWLRKYPNLIKDRTFLKPNSLWVSDITYIEVDTGYCYLSLITDGYSRKIMGYQLSKTLEAEGSIKALLMALEKYLGSETLIHHSDRGVQYCCREYVEILSNHNIRISMTETGDPLENAVAERVNGILKQELLQKKYRTYEEAQKSITNAILIYNSLRPHTSCNMFTPDIAHEKEGPLKRHWKNYYKRGGINGIKQIENNCVNQIQDYI